MQEKRERGLCYYCDEQFHHGHRCKSLKIFLLEGMGSEKEEQGKIDGILVVIHKDEPVEEEREVGELLGISLHAIAGSLTPKTIKLNGILTTKMCCID